jgi:ABC-type Mn2+/Zn2+ transport system ATPase subunit
MGDPAPAALSIKGLRKVYRGGFTALSDLDLKHDDGAFFGLLGPNGAGKTTLIGSVCNIVKPTSGELTVSATTTGFGRPGASLAWPSRRSTSTDSSRFGNS